MPLLRSTTTLRGSRHQGMPDARRDAAAADADADAAAADAAASAVVDSLLRDEPGNEPARELGGAAVPEIAGANAGANPNPMVAIAQATMEAQGPRPTFGDFAQVPAQNPFNGTEAQS